MHQVPACGRRSRQDRALLRMREQNMDRGTGRVARAPSPAAVPATPQEFEGVVQGGMNKLLNGLLPAGMRVQLRIKK